MQQGFTVVGGGTMGAGIAYVAAISGYQVTIVEPDAGQGSVSIERIGRWARKAADRGKLTDSEVQEVARRLDLVTELTESPAGPEVLVEAVPERPHLKTDVLADAETLGPKVLASNTSSLSISRLAESLRRPGRFLGLHFFNPVYAMPLLEIVVGEKTDGVTRDDALSVASQLGKEPIVVRDAPGFATSRLGNALGLEAIRMYESGVASAADIDKAMSLGYRHPVGPLELSDVIGLDVRLDIARSLRREYGERFAPPQLLVDMVAEGNLGRKSGQGFYRWVDGKRV